MIDFLKIIRASWLAGLPLSELIAPCKSEMFRTLAVHWYGELDMMAFRAKSANKAYS